MSSIDPISKRVTHLVVRPSDEDAAGDPARPDRAGRRPATRGRRSRSAAPWKRSTSSSRCRSTPTCGSAKSLLPTIPNWDVGVQDVLALPLLRGRSWLGLGISQSTTRMLGLIYDRVPKGEVEIRRSSAVYLGGRARIWARWTAFVVDGEAAHHARHPRARPSVGAARRHDPDRSGREGRDGCGDPEPLEGPGGRARVGSGSPALGEDAPGRNEPACSEPHRVRHHGQNLTKGALRWLERQQNARRW